MIATAQRHVHLSLRGAVFMNILLRPMLLAAVLFAGTVFADDLSGAGKILCSTQEVSLCATGFACTRALPEELNIPLFIKIDVKGGMLSTTAASGENRTTPASVVRRDAGQLILQGSESGRAFSLFIQESTGWASFAAVSDERSVVAFAACTPDD